jgi:hypothetical protein
VPAYIDDPGAEEAAIRIARVVREQRRRARLRDYFAGQALVGLIARGELWDDAVGDAWTVADLMLEQRARE